MSLQPQQQWQKGKKETPVKVRLVRTIVKCKSNDAPSV